MEIIQNYLTKNRCYQQNVKRTPIGIQLHTIGTAQGSAQAVADYWNQAAVSACVTYLVDCDIEGKVLQLLPEDVRTWADAGYGNQYLITLEICESDAMRYTGGADYTVLDEKQFQADLKRGYQTAVRLCADICRRYGWDPTEKLSSGLYRISSHDEGRRAGLSSAHVDPSHIWPRIGKTMDAFRQEVKAALEPARYEVQAGAFRERKNADTLAKKIRKAGLEAFVKQEGGQYKIQAGSFSSRENAGKRVEALSKAGFSAFVVSKTF